MQIKRYVIQTHRLSLGATAVKSQVHIDEKLTAGSDRPMIHGGRTLRGNQPPVSSPEIQRLKSIGTNGLRRCNAAVASSMRAAKTSTKKTAP